jgi:hypothetical protein
MRMQLQEPVYSPASTTGPHGRTEERLIEFNCLALLDNPPVRFPYWETAAPRLTALIQELCR